MSTLVVTTPIGNLKLRLAGDSAIIRCVPTEESPDSTENVILNKARYQLALYFLGKLKKFDLPLGIMEGTTPFKIETYERCRKIPFGSTLSYSQIATDIERPGAARAVGSCMRDNPLLIFIPCHRVVTSSGDTGQYVLGKDKKIWLLNHERRFKDERSFSCISSVRE